jgi:acyl-CoA thioesterase I
MFYGDSICVGQYISIHKGWVPRISASLEKLSSEIERQIVVTNNSQNGRTTRQALESIAYEVQSNAADILLVQFGMNDCNYWQSDRGLPRVSKKAFEANLHEIIDRALKFDTYRVFLNTNHPTGKNELLMPYTNITYQQSNEQYNDIIRRVAQNRNDRVYLNDIEKAFTDHLYHNSGVINDYLLPEPDLLHLSEKGHDLYYNVVYDNLKKVVLELIRS